MDSKVIKDNVQDYYGKKLESSSDLKTNACCTDFVIPRYIKRALSNIHDEVMSKYYGCGLIIPFGLENCHVLDLGCGAGRDCYILSQLTGENGRVVGVDMTPEQLEVARKHQAFHSDKFGYKKSNVEFLEGQIEHLDEIGLKNDSFDLIVSNCVLNLSTDKKRVLQHAWNLLKVGGEMYFSDVYADRRIPKELAHDPVLYGECLSGALYWSDFLNMAKEVGFKDIRMVEWAPITVNNPDLQEKLGDIKFYSVTYRLFKVPNLELNCEDYGQAILYKGTLPHSEEKFILDQNHVFQAGCVQKVCSNTYLMLHEGRFKKHFDFFGDFSKHFGMFEGCGTTTPFKSNVTEKKVKTSCC